MIHIHASDSNELKTDSSSGNVDQLPNEVWLSNAIISFEYLQLGSCIVIC